MDIIERIDEFLENIEDLKDAAFVQKDSVLGILEIIKEEVDDDTVFLDMFSEEVERNWSLSNKSLLINFYKVLKYYGITEGDGQKKTVLNVKGKSIVRKFVNLSENKQIKSLLMDVI